MSEHARLSPSSAKRWISCPGSLAMEEALPKTNTDSAYSREGTAAHTLAQWALTDNANRCEAYVGKKADNGWVITEGMATDTQVYVDHVLEYAEGNALFVEKRVDFSETISVPNSFGTSDAIIINEEQKEIVVIDLKFGRGIEVSADGNEQLMLYALGALNYYELFYNLKKVRLVICQPRLNKLSEWDCTVGELRAFGSVASKAGQLAVKLADAKCTPDMKYLVPGEEQCQWCTAAATCEALAKRVTEIVGAEFEDISATGIKTLVPTDPAQLSIKMKAIDLIETFCKAVRAETERTLFAGIPVQGWKIVQGKRGNRTWVDEAAAEANLKSYRLKVEEMYNLKLISPTDAEKLLAKDNPGRWKKLQSLITRAEGRPSVAPVSDKRPAIDIKPIADEFDNIEESLV